MMMIEKSACQYLSSKSLFYNHKYIIILHFKINHAFKFHIVPNTKNMLKYVNVYVFLYFFVINAGQYTTVKLRHFF